MAKREKTMEEQLNEELQAERESAQIQAENEQKHPLEPRINEQ